jgi:hypothetical protein
VDLEAHRAVLRICDGDSPKPLVERKIEYTDFDLAAITIWAEDNGDPMPLVSLSHSRLPECIIVALSTM